MSLEGFLYLLVSLSCIALAIAHSISGARSGVGRPTGSGTEQLKSKIEILALLKVRAVWHLLSIMLLALGVLFFLMAQKPLSTPMVSGLLAATFLAGAVEVFAITRARYFLWVVLGVLGAISWLATARFVQQAGWGTY